MSTGQNRSSAVMQQRSEPHNSLDDFPTPPWAVRALCEWMMGRGENLEQMVCAEPAANRGYMVSALQEYFGEVRASDVHDYGAGFAVEDYLFGPSEFVPSVDITATNPPFSLAEQFIARALETSRVGVAMLVRSAFVEGEKRYKRLFSKTPPTHVLQFAERVVMLRGRLIRAGATDPANINPKTGKPRKASSATSYCWLVWLRWDAPLTTRFVWIEPCRRKLEQPGDYPPDPSSAVRCKSKGAANGTR